MIKTTRKLKTSNTSNTKTAKAELKSNPPAAKTVARKIASEPVKVEAPKTVPLAAPTKPSNQVCLELVNPSAKTVYVAGSFNQWKPEETPLVPAGNGRWVRDLSVKPGRHEYLFVVDGHWLPDPNAKETVANPFGGKNSVLIVSE